MKKQIGSEFATLRQKAELVRLTYNHQSKFQEVKRNLIKAVHAFSFEDFAANLPEGEILIIRKAE